VEAEWNTVTPGVVPALALAVRALTAPGETVLIEEPVYYPLRDAVELPFLHPDLYREHRLTPPRGVLLYGPPGCGKTLIAKAVAASLGAGGRGEAYFLNIKGPQLLDKYVGETERRIRVIFARAREKAATGVPVVVFFDEMDSLFRTRGSGRSSDVETTVVPQMLAEIDGVDELDNVVVIGATNREDMIDPAILRPGRLDVKIRIGRPDRRGAAEILATYLTPDLPISEELLAAHGDAQGAVDALIEQVIEALYPRRHATEMVELTRADGQVEILHVADLVSGAMLANIVDRAKKAAVKDLVTKGRRGLTSEHLRRAVIEEIMENEGLPATVHPDDWARVSGRRGTPVVSMSVLQRSREEGVPWRRRAPIGSPAVRSRSWAWRPSTASPAPPPPTALLPWTPTTPPVSSSIPWSSARAPRTSSLAGVLASTWTWAPTPSSPPLSAIVWRTCLLKTAPVSSSWPIWPSRPMRVWPQRVFPGGSTC